MMSNASIMFKVSVAVAFLLSPLPARSQSGTPQAAPSVTQADVKLVIGGESIKKSSKGTLSIEGNSLKFAQAKGGALEVQASSILEVSTDEDSRQNITGAAKVATMAIPYGGGRVLSLFSHGVDVLTVEFADAKGAYHAVIFELPAQRQAAPFKRQLVAMGAKTSVPLEEPAANKSEKKP